MTAPPTRLHLAAAALSLLAAAGLVFALLSPTFWIGGSDGVEWSIGLLRAEVCGGSGCMVTRLDRYAAPGSLWDELGLVCFALAALTALAQIALAVAALRGARGRRVSWAVAPALAAIVVGWAFVFALPSLPDGGAIGPAMIATFVGGLVAIVATVLHNVARATPSTT